MNNPDNELIELKQRVQSWIPELSPDMEYKWVISVYKSLFLEDAESVLAPFINKMTFKTNFVNDLNAYKSIPLQPSLNWIKSDVSKLEDAIKALKKSEQSFANQVTLNGKRFEIVEFEGTTNIKIEDKSTKLINAYLKTIQSRVIINEDFDVNGKIDQRIFIIQFTKQSEMPFTLEIPHSSLTSVKSLNEILLKHKLHFSADRYFAQFIEYIMDHFEYETVHELNACGYHESIGWVFSDGILSNLEFFSINKNRMVTINKKAYYIPERVNGFDLPIYNSTTASKAEILAFIHTWMRVNSSLNVASLIGYAIATMLRPFFYKKKEFFPVLFFNGQASTGKTTNADYLFNLLGFRKAKKISMGAQTSEKYLIRNMTKFKHLPIFIDDYRNQNYGQGAFSMNMILLNVFNGVGGGIGRKTTDASTFEYRLKNSLVLTGNELPKDSPVLTRLMILNYDKIIGAQQQNDANFLFENKKVLFGMWKLMIPYIEMYISEHSNIFWESYESYLNELKKCQFEGRQADIWALIIICYEIWLSLFKSCSYQLEDFSRDLLNSKGLIQSDKMRMATEFIVEAIKIEKGIYSNSFGRVIDDKLVAYPNQKDDSKVVVIIFNDVWNILTNRPFFMFKTIQKDEMQSLLWRHPALIEKSKATRFNSTIRRGMSFDYELLKNEINFDVTM